MDFAPLTDADAANGMAAFGPSPINAEKRFYPPKEMDRDDIRRVLDKFREAARRLFATRGPKTSPFSIASHALTARTAPGALMTP